MNLDEFLDALGKTRVDWKSRIIMDIKSELRELLNSSTSVESLVLKVKEYKKIGVSKDDVLKAFESLREECLDEEIDDTILDVMDYLVGFCSPQCKIWDE